jgi:hypothetical protein
VRNGEAGKLFPDNAIIHFQDVQNRGIRFYEAVMCIEYEDSFTKLLNDEFRAKGIDWSRL